MFKGSDRIKYVRDGISKKEVWGITYKCASTSMRDALPQPRRYTTLEPGDHVRIIVRDPRDRFVSAWKWFTTDRTFHDKDLLREDPEAHDILYASRSDLETWGNVALKHWNPHWAPQTEIHPRWREFELIPITRVSELGWGHEKKTRSDTSWAQYYTPSMLERVEDFYKEDLELWKEATNVNTRARRVL